MAALAAQNLLPGEGGNVDLGPVDVVGEDSRGGVCEGQAFTVGRDPVGVRNAHARGGAVPGEEHVVGPVDLVEVGQLAVIGAEHGGFQLELLDGVGNPALTEAFPGQRGHAAGAEHGPHGHLEGAGVRTGDDTDAMRIGQLQNFAHQIDAIRKARLADLGAVRAAESFGVQFFGGISGRLGAGTGREVRTRRFARGYANNISHF